MTLFRVSTNSTSCAIKLRRSGSTSCLFVLFCLALLLSSSVASSFASRPTTLTLRAGFQQQPSDLPVEMATDDNPVEAVETGTATTKLGPNAKQPPGFLRSKFPSFPWHVLPDSLTYARCIAIPILMLLFYCPGRHVETGILFAAASFTDWLDGFLARRWDLQSDFGAFLDPVADKLMVSTALILLSGRYGTVAVIPTCIILARELAVSALREWMAQRGQRDLVKVGMQGKVKTALTMVALTMLLFVPAVDGEGWMTKLQLPGLILLNLCSVVTVTSGSVYFIAAAPALMKKNE